jgi:hypothetical protein
VEGPCEGRGGELAGASRRCYALDGCRLMHEPPHAYIVASAHDIPVDRFQVLHDGPFIPNISNVAPAPEALKSKKFSLGSMVL